MFRIFSKIWRRIIFFFGLLREVWLLRGDHSVKIRFTNFWFDPSALDKKIDFFLKPLAGVFARNKQKYRLVHYSRADIQFFSVFGRRHILSLSRAPRKIFFTGECVGADSHADSYRKYSDHCLREVDLALGFEFLDKENYRRLPLWLLYYFQPYDTKEIIQRKLAKFWQYSPRPKFCALVASHDKNKLRTEIYQAVAQIAAVDCAGKLLHNDDSLREQFADDKAAYLRQYKFNICPENARGRGYVTEKLFQSLQAGCIPIYNGYSKDPEPGIINPAVILWYEPAADNKNTLARIKELYSAEHKYREFLAQKCFLPTAADKIHDYLQKYCAALEKIALEFSSK
jgi:hypothetical protein